MIIVSIWDACNSFSNVIYCYVKLDSYTSNKLSCVFLSNDTIMIILISMCVHIRIAFFLVNIHVYL